MARAVLLLPPLERVFARSLPAGFARALGRADRVDGEPGRAAQLRRHFRLLPDRWAEAAISRLAEPGAALDEALAMARTIAANGPLAVRTAKSVIAQSRNWRPDEMFDRQRPLIAHIFTSEDAREGATAFAEKRPPVWKGR